MSANMAWTSIGYSMPKYGSNTNSIASRAFMQDSLLRSTQVFQDHKDPNHYYISPATQKGKAGSFFLAASPNCGELQRNHEITYQLPNAPIEYYPQIAKDNPYFSKYFLISYSFFSQFASIYMEANRKMMDHTAKLEEYKTEFAEFQAAEKDVKDLEEDLENVKLELGELSSIENEL